MVVWVGSLALAGGRWGVVARLGWLKLGGVKQADWARVSRGLDCFVEVLVGVAKSERKSWLWSGGRIMDVVRGL